MLLPVLAFLFGSLLIAAAAMAFAPAPTATIERRLGEVTGDARQGAWRRSRLRPRGDRHAEAIRRDGAAVAVGDGQAAAAAGDGRLPRARGGRGVLRHPPRLRAAHLRAAGDADPDEAQPAARAASAARSATCCRAWRSAAWRSGGSIGFASGCPTRSICSWSASKRGSAWIRRSSASAPSSTSRIPICPSELRLINLELRAGKGRVDALRNLAERTGVDDIVSLVAMLVQTDKFGTSVAQSLRVHSDTVRTKRRQRAEEAAAKTGVKMVFPLVFCIFPAIWVVTIGPAVHQVHRGHRADGAPMSLAAHSSRRTIPNTAPAPPVPTSLHETGLAVDQIEQLLIKTLYGGEATGLALADRMRLPFTMLEPLIERVRAEQLVEVRGSDRLGRVQLPLRADRRRAAIARASISTPASTSARRRCRWPPTSHRCARCAAARVYIDRERLRQGFSHLIISDQVLEQLGPAVNAGKAVFLYGPPGNGKTVIAEGLGPRARRRHVHAARDRRRRPHPDDVRPDQPRVARGRTPSRRASSRSRRATGAGCASGGRS